MSTDQLPLLDSPDFFDLAPCGLVITQEDGTFLRANQTFALSLGFTEQELRGRRFQDLLTMGGRIFHQTHWAPLMKMQGSVAEVKLDLVDRDNHTVTMILNGVRREHAGCVYYELALFGTSDRDKYERELVKARKLAESLLQDKTDAERALRNAQAELHEAYETAQRCASFAEQMIAIVSHDLKNPLTAIKMASDFIARGERTVKETKMLCHINQSALRAERMIADLLDLAVARTGRGIAINPTTVDLHSFIARSIEELRIAFPMATLLHHAVGSGTTQVDKDRVQQIIGNLAANSVAYGDLKQPITITSALYPGKILVSVHNWGPAIPAWVIKELFEPMTRGTDVDSDVRSVGLGLFIVKEIAKAHDGDVHVTSDSIHGTTFTVSFPNVVII